MMFRENRVNFDTKKLPNLVEIEDRMNSSRMIQMKFTIRVSSEISFEPSFENERFRIWNCSIGIAEM